MTFAIGETRRVPLPWQNLLQNKGRTALAVGGVSFPVLLVFLQLGLHDATMRTASLPYDALAFDVVILSAEYVSITKAGTFPRSRLYQALAVPDVQGIASVHVDYSLWRNPETQRQRQILVIGCDPRQRAFRLPEISAQVAGLAEPDTGLIDRLTRTEYGPQTTGHVTELATRRIRIIGQYTLGSGFSAQGAVIVSDQTFSLLFERRAQDQMTLGLVQLVTGADPVLVVNSLRDRLPRDVRVLTRAELETSERAYWSETASLGIIFGLGVLVGLIVQVVLLYQLLSTDITNRSPEYATLKAIGYSDRRLSGIVLQQAMIITGAGYIGGIVVALVLYRVTADATHLPVVMTTARVLGVLALTTALAITATVFALRRLRTADPAALFK